MSKAGREPARSAIEAKPLQLKGRAISGKSRLLGDSAFMWTRLTMIVAPGRSADGSRRRREYALRPQAWSVANGC